MPHPSYILGFLDSFRDVCIRYGVLPELLAFFAEHVVVVGRRERDDASGFSCRPKLGCFGPGGLVVDGKAVLYHHIVHAKK
jgi:hypothetical protein